MPTVLIIWEGIHLPWTLIENKNNQNFKLYRIKLLMDVLLKIDE